VPTEDQTRSARFEPEQKARPTLSAALIASSILLLLTACKPAEEPKAEPIRPVRVMTVEKGPDGEAVSFTGHIKAEDEVNLSFRVGGRMIKRSVNVGDRVSAGQVVARLEEEPARNALRTATANLSAANSQLTRARNDLARQQRLLASGATSRADYDQAVEAVEAAQAQVDSTKAQRDTAEDQFSYTRLVADAAGSVTARGAEPGEVVEAGRMIVRVALEGGRDAVFDVPERVIRTAYPEVEVNVVLASEPNVRTMGRVREVAPQADPVTRTFQVRVGLDNPPAAMRLGSTVIGTIQLDAGSGIAIPASALTRAESQPAVWVVEPANSTVSLRNIDVYRYDLDRVVVAHGLDPGEMVVIAGVQALRPGQKVQAVGTAQ
jgi:RND family efflux transporter MFP subunit